MGNLVYGTKSTDNAVYEEILETGGALHIQDNAAMGQHGAILVTGTTAITGNFKAIHVLADAAFTTLTSDITKDGATTAAAGADFGTVYQGTTLYGKFTAVTLTSGTVLLYE